MSFLLETARGFKIKNKDAYSQSKTCQLQVVQNWSVGPMNTQDIREHMNSE